MMEVTTFSMVAKKDQFEKYLSRNLNEVMPIFEEGAAPSEGIGNISL